MRLDHVVILSSSNPAYNVTYIETLSFDDSPDELDQSGKFFRPIWWWFPVLSIADGAHVYNVTFIEKMSFAEAETLSGHLSVRRERFGFTEVMTGATDSPNVGLYTDIITFAETFSVSVSGDITYNETISVRERMIAWVNTPYQQYYTTGPTSNPLPDPPAVVHTGGFILEYGAYTVTLPAPLLGDSQSQQIIRVNRESRGLTRDIFKDTDWYDVIQWDYRFNNLTLAKKDDFLELVQAAMGDYVTVTDHLNRVRQMLIVDSYEIEEVHNDQCSYSVGALFQEII